MRFVVTMYLAVEAASEDKAREIVDTIEIKSKYEESILNVMDTEVEEVPELSRA